jgi:hypothetical protein
MAIIQTPLEPGSFVWGKGKVMERTLLVKVGQTRQGKTPWDATIQTVRTPHDPQTPAQLAQRAIIKYLGRLWRTMTPETKAAWAAEAEIRLYTAYNWFSKTNLTRWAEGSPPIGHPDDSQSSTPIDLAAFTATGHDRYASIAYTPESPTDLSGLILLRSTEEIITPTTSATIIIIPLASAAPANFTDSTLNPGTWHYRAALINHDGQIGNYAADAAAIVTAAP